MSLPAFENKIMRERMLAEKGQFDFWGQDNGLSVTFLFIRRTSHSKFSSKFFYRPLNN